MSKHWLCNLTFSSTTFTLENYVNDLKNHLEIMPCLKSVRAFFWATLITIYRPQVGYKKTLHPLFSLSKLSWRFLLILLCFINWSSIESPQYICTQTLENQHHPDSLLFCALGRCLAFWKRTKSKCLLLLLVLRWLIQRLFCDGFYKIDLFIVFKNAPLTKWRKVLIRIAWPCSSCLVFPVSYSSWIAFNLSRPTNGLY